ncbi:MAG: hypothetical protein OXE96_07520 [Gemmatimonadetes bacterium]|nr:hypothetical protein [Gemmatimonadota bacterium]
MYTTCMFCTRPLGTNEVVETFPVGRRLAFDAARGRLWVVCARCERWNLTPMEERWEAVEACERIFRDTRVRFSTDNIGLARHPEGLTLVRIGEPLRPEFAAWRYGDQFGRRRRRKMLYGAAGVVLAGGTVVGGLAVGVMGVVLLEAPLHMANMWVNLRTRVKLRPDGGGVIGLRRGDLRDTRIRPADESPGFKVQLRRTSHGVVRKGWYHGEEAHRFAAAIVPGLNAMGGTKAAVLGAAGEIEAAGHAQRFLVDVAGRRGFESDVGEPGCIAKMPRPTRLALEMALHEEQERRALEGELWLLEQAWREAEEIAAISDDLLLPEGTDDFIREHGRARETR